MIDKLQIGVSIIEVTKELIKRKREKINDEQTAFFRGVLVGLMTVLGKEKEFVKADSWLGFVNKVLFEIIEENDIEVEELGLKLQFVNKIQEDLTNE